MKDEEVRLRGLYFPLCWILSLQIIGTYLFTSGFFLTRFEVSSKSNCENKPPLFIEYNKQNVNRIIYSFIFNVNVILFYFSCRKLIVGLNQNLKRQL
jgi:hypothetical protein